MQLDLYGNCSDIIFDSLEAAFPSPDTYAQYNSNSPREAVLEWDRVLII